MPGNSSMAVCVRESNGYSPPPVPIVLAMISDIQLTAFHFVSHSFSSAAAAVRHNLCVCSLQMIVARSLSTAAASEQAKEINKLETENLPL